MRKASVDLLKTIFGLDNAFVRACALIYDLMLVNLLFVLTCLPLVTVGVAKVSLYQAITSRRENSEISIVRTYLMSVKTVFPRGLVLGIGELLITGFALFDLWLIWEQTTFWAQAIKLVSLSVLFFTAMVFLTIYAMGPTSELTLKEVFKRGVVQSGLQLPVTIIAMTVLVLVAFLLTLSGITFLAGMSLLMLGGYAGLVYGHLYLLTIFTKKGN